MKKKTENRVIIFDTTLRDGEQCPGASMGLREKLEVARQLARLNVDIIEAGFPIASPGDFAGVQAVAKEIKGPRIAGLARCVPRDIETCAEAVAPAGDRARIHVFLATSAIHRQYKLKKAKEEIIKQSVKGVKLARKHVRDVQFSPEDASRTEPDFLAEVCKAAIDAGATTINIPDTVGYAVPDEFGGLIAYLFEHIPELADVTVHVHCHNDLGLAVANSLAAVLNGARQVECTINALGERAGNASLEEIVMAVRTRQDIFPVETRIDATQIVPCSRLVSNVTGFPVQPNKAIVGANAFAHESGIHQDGVLKHRDTYEIMRAEDVGWSANRMVLGKHSGRNALRTRLLELGIEFATAAELDEVFARFKDLADKKHDIFDEDLQALVSELAPEASDRYRLKFLQVCSETGTTPRAEVHLEVDGVVHEGVAEGGGPVDASFQAVESIVSSGTELLLYSVNNITSGTDAQGEVTVRLSRGGRIVNGQGADTDIVIASVKAYLNALNRLTIPAARAHPQHDGV